MRDYEKEEYDEVYLEALRDLTKGVEKDARDLLYEELGGLRYSPSDNPRLDAELNVLKSEKKLSAKKKALGGGVNSFIQFKAQADNISMAKARSWANKAMRKED